MSEINRARKPMRLALAAVYATLIASGCSNSSTSNGLNFKQLDSPEAHFHVQMASPWKQSDVTTQDNIPMRMWLYERDDQKGALIMAGGQMPPYMVENPQTQLDNACTSAVSSANRVFPTKETYRQPITLSGKFPGREVDGTVQIPETGPGIFKSQSYIAGRGVYQLTAIGTREFVNSNDVAKFFDSFRVDEAAADAQAGYAPPVGATVEAPVTLPNTEGGGIMSMFGKKTATSDLQFKDLTNKGPIDAVALPEPHLEKEKSFKLASKEVSGDIQIFTYFYKSDDGALAAMYKSEAAPFWGETTDRMKTYDRMWVTAPRVTAESPLMLNGKYPGIQLEGSCKEGIFKARSYIVWNTAFGLVSYGKPEFVNSPATDKFFNSFKVGSKFP